MGDGMWGKFGGLMVEVLDFVLMILGLRFGWLLWCVFWVRWDVILFIK